MAEVKRIIPSRRWYKQTLPEQAVWWTNFAAQFAVVGASLGFTPAEIAAVQDTAAVMQFLANTITNLKAYEKAVRQYRDIITEYPVGEPTPAFPADPAFVLPEVLPTGINQRLNELVDRIRVAPAFTNEIGALLGINPTGEGPVPEAELKPTIKAFDSIGGYKFDVRVVREGMPAYKVQIARVSDPTNWTDAAFSTTRLVTVTVEPTTPGKPEQILVRVTLLKDNEPVGVPSDIVPVTINP